MFNDFFFAKILPFMRQCGKNTVGQYVQEMTKIRRMRFACWISKAQNTRAEYVIFIALSLQQ